MTPPTVVMASLRSYMAYDRELGSEQGACLVFAATAREARRIAGPTVAEWGDGHWIDVTAKWLRSGCPHLRAQDGPHVVQPPTCRSCELWYEAPLNANGLCEMCAEGLL